METKQYLFEEWRDIRGYEGLYQVSNFGRVRSLNRTVNCKNGRIKHLQGRPIQWRLCGQYDAVPLCGKNHYVHVLVAKAFPETCGEWFEGCQVDHIDTDIHNNKATNLKVCTEVQNHNNPLTRKHISEAKVGSMPWNKGKTYKCPGISKALIGKYCGPQNPNAKPILQLTLEGEVIREWDCVKNAADMLKIHRSGISGVLIGNHKTAGGYKWCYVKK